MATLKSTLHGLAEKFADDLLSALRGASLDEIFTTSGDRGVRTRARVSTVASAPKARVGRPSRSAITVQTIVDLLRRNPKGMRSENLRKALGAQRGTWRYQMKKAIAEKKVRMRGTKNSAVYFAT
jgi:hypothetical protein